MKSINILILIAIWVFGHSLIYNTQYYLTEIYAYNIPLIIVVFVAAVYLHSRLFKYMTFKILDHIQYIRILVVGGVATKTVVGLFIALLCYIYLLQTMATFKIKLEDKAAFLNRMEKAGVELNTNQAVDNKLEGYFEVTVDEPKQLEAANLIIKQSPKINTIKEMENKKKLTKDELKEMVRQELQGILAEKKKEVDDKDKLDEATLEESPAAEILSILAGVAGLGLSSAAILKAQDMLKAKKPELYKKLQDISSAISTADPSKKLS